MIRGLRDLCSRFLGTQTLCLALLVLLPLQGKADPDQALADALTNCWNAVAGSGLKELSAYGMEREETKVVRPGVENDVYLGRVQTGVGDIDIKALVRDGFLFDCTMLTFPPRPEQRTIQYDDAAETLDVWFTESLAMENHHDVFESLRYNSLVWCGPDGLAIAADSISMDPLPPEVIEKAGTGPLTGDLRAAIFLSNSNNYESCQ